MKNYEKYVDKIKEYGGNNFCSMFIEPHILKPIGLSCGDLACGACRVLQLIWLTEGGDPKEPEIDWNNVKVDAPILVTNFEDGRWRKRYFAKFEDGKVYAWVDGGTSWSSDNKTHKWNYAKLAEDGKECKEPEIDWNEVNVDTLILVKDCEDEEWKKRYFAKYEDGVVFAWTGEETSRTACDMTKWNYAKLAENEEAK